MSAFVFRICNISGTLLFTFGSHNLAPAEEMDHQELDADHFMLLKYDSDTDLLVSIP
jgi:hypothetical protein